ncbi:MAG: hypothetical protein ACOCUT_02785 [bacterium]
MKFIIFVFLLMGLFVSCGQDDDNPTYRTDPLSCDVTSDNNSKHSCFDYTGTDHSVSGIISSCGNVSGAASTTEWCSDTDKIGKCVYHGDSSGEYVGYYYSSGGSSGDYDVNSATADCNNLKGVFTAI